MLTPLTGIASALGSTTRSSGWASGAGWLAAATICSHRRRAACSSHYGDSVEALPFADDSFDIVVSTIVLCTVQDLALALRETARVLRPGGRLLFIEHLRSQTERWGRWQDRLERRGPPSPSAASATGAHSSCSRAAP